MFSIKKFLGLEYYVSQLDEFLQRFRREHPRLSASQQQEKSKYARIHEMRDKSKEPVTTKVFWDKF